MENIQAKVDSGPSSPSQNVQKKLLPAVPSLTAEAVPPVKIVDRNSHNSKNSQMYGPIFMEYSLMSEYVLLQKQQLAGVYVIPSAGSPLKWFGIMFIRQGLYQGGVFRFTLYVPDNYPDSDCPILVFDPPVFNPVINFETGELDVKRAFPKWRRNVNHLWQVLQYARKIFYKIEIESPLNVQAAELYERDLELFKVNVAECISISHERLYEKPQTDDPHAIQFSPYDPTIHDEVRRKLIAVKADDEQDSSKTSPNGLSWMQPGSLQIFSKTAS